MTNAEHLIENAIFDIEEGKDFEHFSTQKHNKMMGDMSGINLSYVWEMAQHEVEVAREIFEEISIIIDDYELGKFGLYTLLRKIAELKKKYTEEQNNENKNQT